MNGVTRAQVKLEEYEAIVTYDPSKATVEDLIKAVAAAEGVFEPRQYTAKVKTEKPGAS